MNQYKHSIKDSTLQTNLNELVHNVVRELAMACRKVAIYGPGHPSSVRAIEKPFLAYEKILKFKKYLNINLQQGYLYILNVRLKDSVFNQEIIKYMQLADISVVLFEQKMEMSEFGKFIDRFVTRTDISDQANIISTYLKEQNIDTITINTETAYNLFENNKHFRGDVDYDSSLKNTVINMLPDDLEKLADIFRFDAQFALNEGFDYDFDLIQYLIPEKIASIPGETLKRNVIEHLNHLKASDEHSRNELFEVGKSIYKLIMYHPESQQIIEKFDSISQLSDESRKIADDYQSPTGKIKLESSLWVDDLLKQFLDIGDDSFDGKDLCNAILRLLKTGQKDKASEITQQLVGYLSVKNGHVRQRALGLLIDLVKDIIFVTDYDIIESIINNVVKKISAKEETFEYSEFVWVLFSKCLKEKQFALLSVLAVEINKRRRVRNNITIYDSMTIKKIIESFNNPSVIKSLIDELLEVDFNNAALIKDVLVAIGSDDVALELANIISHPLRHVRQHSIKILADLGWASLKVFSNILTDDKMFMREEGRHELPDEKWYIIRNSIFVLGLINLKDAATPLKQRINDPDVRVRREIVNSLEKIDGEEACDILLMMSDDPDKEIYESAVIKFGLIGTPEMAPVLIDMARKNSELTICAVNSLGQLGGAIAKQFLIELISNTDKINEIAAIGVSKEMLRLAIVKALGQIGDDDAIKSIVDFKENLPTTQKLFFKNSSINRAIEEILTRR